jgi:transposase
MRKRYIVNLTADERETLTEMVARKRLLAQKRQRAHILLLADDGWTDQEIADKLDVGVRTIERVRQRCCERGLMASLDRQRQKNPSRPRTLDGAAEARLVTLACSEPPAGRARWTLTLLADELVELKVVDAVSRTTVHRALKKTLSSPGE